MEALKEFDIEELLKRQAMLDRKFDKKETIRKRTPGRTCVAFLTELGELGQELKSDWNYWKNHTKPTFRNTGYHDMYFWKKFYPDFETAFIILSNMAEETENRIFGAMLKIAEHTGATEEEFLQIHHQVWLRNMNERTKGEY